MKGAKGPPGERFKLTSDGNYNIENNTLCNVGKASNDGDAVNLELLKEKSGSKLGYYFADKPKTIRGMQGNGEYMISKVLKKRQMRFPPTILWHEP